MVAHNWLRILASLPVQAISLGLLALAGGTVHLSAASAIIYLLALAYLGGSLRTRKEKP